MNMNNLNKQFDQTIGLDRLKLSHCNDSKTELGKRVDRHDHLGKGKIGLAGFKALVQNAKLAKEITDAISDEDKTKQDAIVFLNQVERELYEAGVEKNHKALEICELTRASLYDRGAPIKMILENLVLSV